MFNAVHGQSVIVKKLYEDGGNLIQSTELPERTTDARISNTGLSRGGFFPHLPTVNILLCFPKNIKSVKYTFLQHSTIIVLNRGRHSGKAISLHTFELH